VRGGHRIKDEDRPKKTPLGILQLQSALRAAMTSTPMCASNAGENV
jgi:hypothetical protein